MSSRARSTCARSSSSARPRPGSSRAPTAACGPTPRGRTRMSDGRLLEGRIALVTGGAGGIGAATSSALAAQGAVVVVVDIDADRTASVVAEVRAAGGQADALVADVRDPADVERIGAHVDSTHGRLDVLVNNVGHWVRVVDFVESEPALWSQLYDVNLGHVFAMTHRFLPGMIDRGDGAIVNVSS